MKTLRLMIKPASSLCNMRCRYCFYHDVSERREVRSFGIMTEETVDAMLRQIASEFHTGDTVEFLFQGGEPTRAGLDFFRAFVQKTAEWKGIRVSFSLQTNGLLLDAEWCAFLREHRFLVGLSFDLLREAHDTARCDSAGKGTYSRLCAAIALLKRERVEFNVLCTLTAEVARHPEAVWRQIVALELSYVQFTPCLDDAGGDSRFALTPERFASFYRALFDAWYADYLRGGRRSIKLFDDVVNLLVLGVPTLCGMDGVCRPQLVIEADGSAYPCDFYCLDSHRMGNIKESPVSALLAHASVRDFCTRRAALPALCADCRWRAFCGGGCPRMGREVYAESGACGYRLFLDHAGASLYRLAEQITRTRNIKA